MVEKCTLKSQTIIGLIWSFFELVMNQGVQLAIQVILARLLSPRDFGIIGMVTIFICISNSLTDSGLSNALIREKEITKSEYSTVFFFNLIISLLIYMILFILSPIIADFFREDQLIKIIRILGLSIIFNSFGIIQKTILIRKIDFKTQTKISISSSIISGIIGVIAAINGLGVLSLVIRTLSMTLIQSVLLFLHNKFIPSLDLDLKSFKRLFGFGWKMVVSGLIDTVYSNIYYIIIGKYFSAVSLGYYSNACKLKEAASQSITGAVQKVSYPVLSKINGDNIKLKDAYRKIIKSTAFIVFPVMIGLCAVGESLIKSLLGEKWVNSTYYFQVLCLEAMLYPIHAINLNILQVKGHANLFLKLEIIKKIVGVIFISGTLFFKAGIDGLVISAVMVSYIDYFINAYYSKDLINYSISDQIRDLYPIFISSILMGVIDYELKFLFHFSSIFVLILQIIFGVLIYVLEGILIKSSELNNILDLLNKLIRNRVFNKKEVF